MNIWQKRKLELLGKSSYHYLVYTNVHVIITLKLNFIILDLKENVVKILTTHLDHNLKDAGYFIRVSIKSFKKSFFRHLCNEVHGFLSSKADSFPNQQWYKMRLDLIESRTYNSSASKTTKTKPKSMIKLHFVNKGMEWINISKIINDKKGKKNVPTEFNSIYIN